MIQNLREKRNGQEGFTLVELLVVIVILGVLASIVVFAVGGITDKGEANSVAADKSSLETAEEAYYANGNASVYASEAELVSGKFLRAASTKNDICLKQENTGTTAIELKKDYQVVTQGTACPGGFSATGS